MGLIAIALGACNRSSPHEESALASERSSASQTEQAYSAQLHVHGSASEGLASIDSQSYEARDANLDVLWWSDHDFRITSYGHVSTFGFEDWRESPGPNPADGHQLPKRIMTRLVPLRENTDVRGTAEFITQNPNEGDKCLRLTATSDTADFR